MVNYCHECGGEMHYVSLTKNYVCKSCGLSCTGQELNDVRDKRAPTYEDEELNQPAEKNTLNGI